MRSRRSCPIATISPRASSRSCACSPAAPRTVGIATELYLSVETVRWHIKSILRKLGVRSRADAIACLEELQAV